MYKVQVAAKSGYRFIAKSNDAEIVLDSKTGAMTPPDALLASLGSCVGVYIRKYADGAKLALGEFEVVVSSDLGAEAPFYFRNIDVRIDLKDAVMDEKRREALLRFIRNCPIHNTLSNRPAIDISIS